LQNISGSMFANKKLSIAYVNPVSNQPHGRDLTPASDRLKQARRAIEAFVTRHYDTDIRMLDLSNLSAYIPDVPLINFNSKQFAVLLDSILAVSCPDILTLVLNQNKISNLSAVAYVLQQSRLKIINISLDSNAISNFDELLALKNCDLRELVLLNNPISDDLDELNYKLEVVKRLPNLEMLDMHKIKQGDTHPITQLPPINGSYFDNPTFKTLAEAFLKKYFDAYDSARDSLVGAYSDQALFSLTHIPNSQPLRRDGTSFRRGKFGAYDPLDRNLMNNPSLDTKTKTMKTGPTHIVGTIIDLPQTKHDYSSFTIDCFASEIGTFQMLNVFVHGTFQETVSKSKRCFSRVFLMAPTPGDAKHEGWPVVIINDQLYVRHYTQRKAKPLPPKLPAQSAAADVQDLTTLLSIITTTPAEEQKQKELIKKMSETTNMNLHYSKECLVLNEWSLERAHANFKSLMEQNRIPQEFFAN